MIKRAQPCCRMESRRDLERPLLLTWKVRKQRKFRLKLVDAASELLKLTFDPR